MSAVAVWSEEPDADALLDARLAAGWEPVPTGTVDGPKILGHACRVATVANNERSPDD